MINKLIEFYYQNETRSFEWGQWDCAHLVKEWVEYSTGYKAEMPEYKTARDSKNIDIIEMCDKHLTRVNHNYTGNIVLFNQKNNLKTLGIQINGGILTIEKYGLTSVKFSPVISWGLPCLQ